MALNIVYKIHSWLKRLKNHFLITSKIISFFQDTFFFFFLFFTRFPCKYFKSFLFYFLIQRRFYRGGKKKRKKDSRWKCSKSYSILTSCCCFCWLACKRASLFRFPSALTLFLLFSSPLAMDLLNYVWLTVKVLSTEEIGGISARTTRIEEDWFCFEIRSKEEIEIL